jgi:selenocysteine lyase/cysteine desulfurase
MQIQMNFIFSLFILCTNTIKSFHSNKYNKDKKFGRQLLEKFYLDPEYINVNHGSYGSPPREVVEQTRKYQEQMDFNTEKWIRYTIYEKLNETRKIIGEYINADHEDIVIVENASDGVNSVLKSLLNKKGEKILIFDLAYGMVKSAIDYLIDTYGIEKVEVKLTEDVLNADDDVLLNIIESTIIKNWPIKIASIDHISSVPALIFPVKKIIELLKKHDIIVLIDGAHSVGQIKLNITDINPDFYISNFHKWGYAPKSASFLFVSKKFQKIIHPNIISHFYNKGFSSEFSFTGTRDYSAYFSIKDALIFRKNLNDDDIFYYIKELAWEAGNVISELWNTDLLIRKKDKIGSLINVRVPCKICDPILLNIAAQKTLFERNTYLPIFIFNNGKVYTRLSAQIYNELSDFINAANIFLQVLNEIEENHLSNLK